MSNSKVLQALELVADVMVELSVMPLLSHQLNTFFSGRRYKKIDGAVKFCCTRRSHSSLLPLRESHNSVEQCFLVCILAESK